MKSDFRSRDGSHKIAIRQGDATTLIKKGAKGSGSGAAEKFLRSGDG